MSDNHFAHHEEAIAVLTPEHKIILQALSLYTICLTGALSSLAAPTFWERLLLAIDPSSEEPT